MNCVKVRSVVALSVLVVLTTACSSIHAASPLEIPSKGSASTTTFEIDGGACRLKAISVCPVPTTAFVPAP